MFFFLLLLRIGNRQAYQPDGADGIVHFLQQLLGQGENVLQVMKLLLLCQASSDLLEVIELDFQCQGIAAEFVTLQPFGQFGGHMIQLDDDGRGLGDVLVEGMLASHRLADALRLDRAKVDAPGKLIIELSCFAEVAGEHLKRALLQFLSPMDT